MEPLPQSLSSDKAEVDPANDVLGYAPFAKYLAKSIVQMTPQSGIVIGIYAPWGAGKTTLLNFVQHYFTDYADSERPVVIHFNPWWFSGQDDLARIFFGELFSALGKQERFKDLREKIVGYADLLGAIPIYGSALKEAAKVAKPAEKSISALKLEVSDALQKIDGKILVVIDDIDRLTAEETRQLFRVVKAVADFPNVIYLLAFDRSVAAKALESVHVGDGDAHLEKIVQVPFELPMPDSTSLDRMLFSRLDAILGIDSDEGQVDGLFEASHWANVYREGICLFIETPRDVVRLTNTLSVTYPSVRGEVNPVYFIAIETLRVFLPNVYNIIRNNQNMFAGSKNVQDYEKEQFEKFHMAWFEEIAQEFKKPVQDLLLRLLPRTHTAWDIKWSRSDDPSRWSRKRRVAHQDVFPVYFRLAPPSNDLPNTQINQLVTEISDAKTFAEKVVQLQISVRPDGASLARRFLERFEDYTDDLPKEKIPAVIQGLIDAGDTLLAGEEERQNAFWDFGMHIQVARIFHQLLHRLSEPARFEILKDAITQTTSYFIVAEEVATMGQEHGKYGSQQRDGETTVTLEHLGELERIALPKIRSRVSLDDFKGSMRLRRLLYIWQELASPDEVGDWLKEVVAQDDGLLKVLTQFSSPVKSQTSGAPLLRRTYRLDPFWFKPYVDPSTLRERVSDLASRSDLTSEQRIAALQFLQEFEDRDDGLNPDELRYEPRRTVYDRYNEQDLNKNKDDE